MPDEPELLLDTCAVIYLSLGSSIASGASMALRRAAEASRMWVSPVSAWEIGMGAARGRLNLPLSPAEFFQKFLSAFAARECLLTSEIVIASSYLPGQVHKDPMDRMLIATARKLGMVLVTRDGLILHYGEVGHLRTLAC